MNLRTRRNTLGLSQSRLARMSGVSRFKICSHELGGGSLTSDEENRIRVALHAEADRLRNISTDVELGQPAETEPPKEVR